MYDIQDTSSIECWKYYVSIQIKMLFNSSMIFLKICIGFGPINQYNGVTFYDNKKPSASVPLDASLTGLGGVYGQMVSALDIPKGYMDYSIFHLEI